jgi:MFS family permease
LFLFRLGVGVGEAGGVAPSYALIADYFPPAAAPGRWPSTRSACRSAWPAERLIGAYIASWIDWRAAFMAMGVAGILLAPIMLLFVRDLPRAKAPPRAPPLLARPSRSSRASRPSG